MNHGAPSLRISPLLCLAAAVTSLLGCTAHQAKRHCIMHPKIHEIPWQRDFDVIYDGEVAKLAPSQPNTMEVLLDHEIIGHVVPLLDDPTWIDRPQEETEPYSRERENEYRQHNGMPLVPSRAIPQPAAEERKP